MSCATPHHRDVFDRLPASARDMLARAKNAVDGSERKTLEHWSIATECLDRDTPQARKLLLADVATFCPKGARTIYCIEAQQGADAAACLRAFAARPDGDRKFARNNGIESCCLYVGSSVHMAQRLKEHLGFGAAGTYALQLAYWAADLGCGFMLTCATYDDRTPPLAIQTMEDALWDELRPMFGRRGTR